MKSFVIEQNKEMLALGIAKVMELNGQKMRKIETSQSELLGLEMGPVSDETPPMLGQNRF